MLKIISVSLTYAVAQLALSAVFWGLMEYSALAARTEASQWGFLYDKTVTVYIWAALANGVILGIFTTLLSFIPVPSYGWAIVLATGTVFIDAVISSLSSLMYPPGIISVLGFMVMWAIYAAVHILPGSSAK